MKKKLLLIFIFLLIAGFLFAADASATEIAIKYQGVVFDDIYNLMQRQLNLSFRSLKDNIVPSLLLALITLEIMWLGTQAILQKTMPLSEVLVKGFLICLVVIITQNLDFFAKGLMQIFTKTAYVAGDSGNLYSDTIEVGQYALFRPSIVISSCQSMLEPLSTAREQISKHIDSINTGLNIAKFFQISIPAYCAMGACWVVELILLVMVTFVNINITMWMIEFNFLLVVCAICLPWQIFSPTKFVASGIWQALFGQAIKMFCVVLLVAIAPKLFRSATSTTVASMIVAMTTSEGFAYQALLGLVVTTIGLTLTYCYFLMKGPSIAKAIIVGQPTMETMGTHMITRMGANAVGAAAGIVSLPVMAGAHGLGSLIGGITSGRSSDKQTTPSPSTGVNEGKTRTPDTSTSPSSSTTGSKTSSPSTPSPSPSGTNSAKSSTPNTPPPSNTNREDKV